MRDLTRQKFGTDATSVMAFYLAAVERGDEVTAQSLEDSPRAFPLVTEAARQQADAIRVARSEDGPRVEKCAVMDAAVRGFFGAARSDLRTALESAGVFVPSPVLGMER